MKEYYVYILASKKDGTLYIGVSNNLIRRVQEHNDGINQGFTKKYLVKKIVYYEVCSDVNAALLREKQLKKRSRKRKIALIEKENPERKDLYNEITD